MLALAAAADAPAPATFYVRDDGGSAEQCDGRHDAAYPGKGTHQACAWWHPFEALPPGGPARIGGGDTLLIGAGDYMMGRGARGTKTLEKCRADWPWDCHAAAPPSGTAQQPTRIVGAGWDTGCAKAPQLWGTEHAATVLDLTGSSHIEVACLDITDHSSCIEFHAGTRQVERCERDTSPFGEWAAIGIVASDSSDVKIRDVAVHGLAHDGLRVGGVRDWTLERVKIVANGWSGWNGDLDDKSSNTGHIVFRDVEIAWNGCAERYPSLQHVGCWGQQEGGYGDGLGVGETSGDWLFERVNVHHNTQDGIDLWHARANAAVVLLDVHAEANAGNQIKLTGSARVEHSTLIGNCAALAGEGSLQESDLCRAQGNTLALNIPGNAHIAVSGNDIRGEGDCLIQLTCGGNECRNAQGTITDNRLAGSLRKDAHGLPKPPCSVWVEPELRGAAIDYTNNRQSQTRTLGCPTGIASCGGNEWSPVADGR
jgi:hypothetical protein